jgi:very-short-patch-repair endonuclease
LWSALRGRRFAGLKWRRQAPWGPYALDFFCKELRLVLEVDGGYHDDADQRRADQSRRLSLERAGIKVVRLRNEEVMRDVEGALEKIIRGAEAPAPL